jgi:hypothetical protein
MNEEETTAEELRELVRQGHMLIKDMKRIAKEMRDLIQLSADAVEAAKRAPKVEIVKEFNASLDEAKESIIKDTVELTGQLKEFVADQVYERFGTLMDVLIGSDRGRRPETVPDIIKANVNLTPEQRAQLDDVLKPMRSTRP